MKYETPFVQSVGAASQLVQGDVPPHGDFVTNITKQPMSAFASSLEEE